LGKAEDSVVRRRVPFEESAILSDAIQQDASGANFDLEAHQKPVQVEIVADQTAQPPQPDPRMSERDNVEEQAAKRLRENAADRLRKQVEAEAPATPPTPEVPEAPLAERPRDDKGRFAPKDGEQPATGAEQQPAAQEAQPAPIPALPADQQTVKVKINGQEREVPLTDVIREYQIGNASRAKLEEASRMKKEAEQILGFVQQFAPAMQGQQQQPAQQAPGKQMTPQERAANLARVVHYGSEQEIADALAEVLSGTQPSDQPAAIPPEQLIGYVEQRLAQVRQEQQSQTDLQALTKTHSDMFADEDMQLLWARRAEQAMRDELLGLGADPIALGKLTTADVGHFHREAQAIGRATPTVEVFEKAAQSVRDRFAPSKTSEQMQARVDAKRAADPVPAAMSVRTPAPQPKKPATAAEVVARERADRGLIVV
jgi:hypothetical protein